MVDVNFQTQIRNATRTLLSSGAVAATEAIQEALGGRFARRGSASADFVTDPLGVSISEQVSGDAKHPWQPTLGERSAEAASLEAKSNGQFLLKSFTNQAGTRPYKLYLPASYDGQALPLIVMLHGCTQNPDDFAVGTRMNALAEEHGCLVVYPGQAQSANSSKCWNWFGPADQKRGQGEPSIIAGITRQIMDDYGVDARKVYVAGLSAGGAMAVIMATTYPDLYAAVGVHSGLPYACARDVLSAFSAMRGSGLGAQPQALRGLEPRVPSIPMIVFHGDRDSTVHASNGDQLIEQHLAGAGADPHGAAARIKSDVLVEVGQVPQGHRYTRTQHRDEAGRSLAELWAIHGAGHAWAGGDQGGSYTDAKGPDASREMLRFFYAQARA